ncbi:MAG: type III glutamate--ammonia ligase [Alphaproteobacteria bacterium]|nr:MAG: type III glutamate--ammonia ligase [Alphaproteobacteria bacterium]
MTQDLAAAAKERGIAYFLISFTDLFGVMRAKLVPASAIAEMQVEGAGFAGFAVWLDMTPAHPDMLAVPDPDSLIQLPWKPEVGWLAADLWMEGAEVDQGPRNTLKRVLARAAEKGWRMKSGVECEFHLVTPDGSELADPRDTQSKPCYDVSALMRQYDVIREICDAMQALGWEPYQNDHEDANGQFEMNFGFADALTTADRHAFFKFMVKSVAEKHGLRATFMPKPFRHLTGNGCHMHISLWDAAGQTNLFADDAGELGISAMGYDFLGGLIHHAQALTAISNPTVNSYKRINAERTTSGATWSPNTITFGGNNRTHMIRIPGPGRFELRLADGAVNPYLYQAAVLVAGMEGIAHGHKPGKRLDIDMYAEGHKVRGAKKLPLNLLDALRMLERDKALRAGLGEETTAAYVKLRMAEWDEHMRHLSEWEREQTLDC